MKKSTLALVVMGIVASASVQAAEIYNKDGNKLDVYGKVKAMHYMSDNDSKDGDQSYIRFGFKGETQINDQLTGYGRWEAEFAGNKAESDTAQQKTRLAFAGLKYKDLGSFDYGRNLGALYDVEAWTDMFPEFGGDSSAQTDNFMTKRASGLATYRNTDFFGVIDGLNLTLQYQGKNENRDVKKQNGDGFGTSLTYDFGGSDFAMKNMPANRDNPFGGGAGAGIKITPVAFLVIRGENVRMLPVAEPASTSVDRLIELLPDLLEKGEAYFAEKKAAKEAEKAAEEA